MLTMLASCHACIPGGLQKNSYGDAQSRVKNFDHLYTSKSVILWPISLPFFCKKHPIWDKLGAFLAKFSKIHPILQIGRIGYVTITHPSIYQTYENAPQNLWASPYTICQWEPPGCIAHLCVCVHACTLFCVKAHTVRVNLLFLGKSLLHS